MQNECGRTKGRFAAIDHKPEWQMNSAMVSTSHLWPSARQVELLKNPWWVCQSATQVCQGCLPKHGHHP